MPSGQKKDSPSRIAIAGIGGVGGYYGGMLAAHFQNFHGTEIHFIARGEHAEQIRRHGLKLITDEQTVTAHPRSVTDEPATLGKLDLIVLCCKAYDLEQLAASLKSNLHERTLLLPLLNGIGHAERIEHILHGVTCLHGCTYLVSKRSAPGTIRVSGNFNRLLFGKPGEEEKQMKAIEKIFTRAGIIAEYRSDILPKTWEKFSFLSPIATYTSAYDQNIGSILADENASAELTRLMKELILLARHEGISMPMSVIQQNFEVMRSLPPATTSSMQVDFSSGNKTELETLTGYVVRKARAAGIEAPAYEKLYEILLGKAYPPGRA